MAIISWSKPKQIADLIGYQSLILGASQLCHDGQWILYDRRFWLKASASHTRKWSIIDVTIWNMALPDKTIKNHQSQSLNILFSLLELLKKPALLSSQENANHLRLK